MKNQLFTEEKLNILPNETIIMLLLQQNENFRILSEQSAAIQKQNGQLLKQVEDLKEQLTILTRQRFGTRSEKNLQISGRFPLTLTIRMFLMRLKSLRKTAFRKNLP